MESHFLKINEIFYSIQGESSWVGLPCVFVRLKGCPHRCKYCDTSYAFTEGNEVSIQEIVSEVLQYGVQTVEITGGEPLIQPNVHLLMTKLCDEGKRVLIETCGSRDISVCDPRVIRIIDIKTPCSGANDSFLESNYDELKKSDEIKFVITSKEDFEFACSITEKYGLVNRVNAIHVSPVMEQSQDQFVEGCEALQPSVLASWLLETQLPLRLHFQTHKYIWPSQMRGV